MAEPRPGTKDGTWNQFESFMRAAYRKITKFDFSGFTGNFERGWYELHTKSLGVDEARNVVHGALFNSTGFHQYLKIVTVEKRGNITVVILEEK